MTSSTEPVAEKSSWIWTSLIDNLPFVAIIVLGLVGISWTSLSQTPTATYWVIVTPLTALICIAAGWRRTVAGERIAMAITQILQWAAVLVSMYLLTVSDVQRSLNANATGLMILTVLALGVFVSGLNLRSWKLALTGAFLAVSVPAIAWLQHAALLLVLVGLALIALLVVYRWLRDRFGAKT
ncbi:hypothetical protein [Roseiarcus sp.]|uniref:hypothetical protein n=1 Tax=Roseiarcus sp. TaxID=1969460 RepID=UPI003F9B89DD